METSAFVRVSAKDSDTALNTAAERLWQDYAAAREKTGTG